MLRHTDLLIKKPKRFRVETRATRRRLVAAAYGMALLAAAPFYVLVLLADRLSGQAAFRSVLFVCVSWGIVATVVSVYCWLRLTRNWNWITAGSGFDGIDERMSARKNQALAYSFWILGFASLFEYCVWSSRILLKTFLNISLPPEIAGGLFGLNAALMISLPVAVIAWIEPNAAADDDTNLEVLP